jgi:hypothetical protein
MNEKFEGELDRRVLVEDLKWGFKPINEFLKEKHKEITQVKDSLTDLITFVKLYLPSKVQL